MNNIETGVQECAASSCEAMQANGLRGMAVE